MKFSFYHIIVVCGLCLGSISLGAQSTTRPWQLYLTDGNYLQVERIDTLSDGQLRVQSLNSTEAILLPASLVKRVKQSPRGSLLGPNGRTVQAEGWYLEGGTMLLAAETAGFSEEVRSSLSFQFGAGCYYRPWLSLGAGIAIDWYDEAVMPLFGQARAYLPQYSTTPYLQLQLGYGIPTQDLFERDEFERTYGGLFWHPAIGIRLATKRRLDYHLDIGYRFQKIRHEFNAPDD
ncbi:MAG: hypothetical protein D6772_12695, partial [Bacteroidetes bacterium]